ncbi:PREDICTED: coiled-coil domain-containing protein 134-like [Nicrophorus vespilloides]|uniref:Coiled-coil domain-containing protein 134-like n=1 Tax=Nicrophorus vespilloides TaxID=110193 RepID=A0ABM1MHF8_NICVS|nr:PREDICTED: coiled-coil domain-containing protein 134-like [Nicrophorus vespilloides]
MYFVNLLVYVLFVPHYTLSDSSVDVSNSKLNEELYVKLFKRQRVEQLEAVKSIRKLSNYDQQYNMILLMADKIFTVILKSRAEIESSGYIPGISDFPNDDNTKDALSNILENTALFSEILLRLPDISISILKTNNNWDMLLQWSIAFAHQVQYLLDESTIKLLHLVSQELNHTEKDPNYVNTYRKVDKINSENMINNAEVKKKRRKKVMKRGPRLHNEL